MSSRTERRSRDIEKLQEHLKVPENAKRARQLLKAYNRATLEIDTWLSNIDMEFEVAPQRGDLISALLNLRSSEEKAAKPADESFEGPQS